MIGFSDYKEFEIQDNVKIQDECTEYFYKNTRLYFDRDTRLNYECVISNSENIILDGQTYTADIRDRGCINFKNCRNVKVCNLKIIGGMFGNKRGAISIQFNNCKNVLIENCTFIDGEDEQVSIKNGSDYVTITNCKFIHNKRTHHTFSILVGKNRNDIPESKQYHITIHQCYFNGGAGRNPRFRNSIMHILNCIWDSNCSHYLIGPEDSKFIIDKCFNFSSTRFFEVFGDFYFRILDMGNLDKRWHKIKHNEYRISNKIPEPEYEYEVLELEDLLKKLNVTLYKQEKTKTK